MTVLLFKIKSRRTDIHDAILHYIYNIYIYKEKIIPLCATQDLIF